ncbi:MAG TPA: polyphenol oxidase family protein [Longimicrobiales bacterium]|nr:polyphenol oxidase family protein [Longimicrobiales bacterium]
MSGPGDGDEPFDLGLFGAVPVGRALERWGALRRATGMPRAVHARQVHGARVLAHGDGPPGLLVSEGYDGHWTDVPGVLLTVSVADCVPIFLVDPERRAVAVLHAGWRGVAAGMLEAGLRALAAGAGSRPQDVRGHFGPAICGACYEVGPEVHEALGLPVPAGPTPVDLRAELARRALSLGVPAEAVTLSEHCTRCTGSPLFSHRGGDAARQMGFIGIRPDA